MERDPLIRMFARTWREMNAPVLQPGHSYRTRCGTGRVAYRPDWDKTKPYATYYKGTAGAHAATLNAAKRILQGKGCKT